MTPSPPKCNKLRPPQIPAEALPRPALLSALRDAAHRGVTLSLLRAPVGYGKSTLLAQYAEHLTEAGQPWAWYRLDDSDNHTPNLLVQLCHALELPLPGQTLGRTDEARLWTAIVNHLESRDTVFSLILDDFHLLRSRAACAYLNALLHHPPKHLHLLVSCEGEPSVALSHLHRQRHLQTLNATDLALDSAEIRALASAHGQQLDNDQVYLLQADSEGWISGVLLSLCAYADASLPDIAEKGARPLLTEQAFEHITAFISEELLQQLAQPVRRFLERVSLVSAFDADLARYLSGNDNSERLIRQLQRQDLLMQQSKGRRVVFRLHPLLRQTLYHVFQRREPNQLRQLHMDVASWLLDHRCYAEAIYQLGRARDYNRLLATLEQHCFDLLREGEVNRIVDFLAKVPGQTASEHFTLAVTEASTVIVTNDISHASGCLQRLQRLIRRQEVPGRRPERVHQTLAFVRSRLAALGGNFSHGLALVERATSLHPGTSAATAVLHFNRAICLLALGRAEQARLSANQALAELEALGFSGYTNMLQLLLGQIELAQGQIDSACERFRQTELSPSPSGSFYNLFLLLGRGMVQLEQNRLDQAAQSLGRAEAIALAFPHSAGLPLVIHYQACRLLSQGETTQAATRWDEARQLARQCRLFALYRQIGAWRVRLACTQGDQDFILSWLEQWHACRRLYGTALMPEEWLAYAWVQRHLGQRASARQISQNLHTLADTECLRRLQLDLHLLDATLQRDEGNQDEMFKHLEQALQLAAQYGFGQLTLLEGQQLAAPLRQLFDTPTRQRLGLEQPPPSPVLLTRLLPSLLQPATTPQQPLAEPLTRREHDVLRRMADGQSNQHIADGLYISLSTVKTHINKLFRKLDARDRDSALQAARALKLLD